MKPTRLDTIVVADLQKEQVESWQTWGPNSEGTRGLLVARDLVWDIDGTDWIFRVTAVWTPREFMAEFDGSTGVWRDVCAWLAERYPAQRPS